MTDLLFGISAAAAGVVLGFFGVAWFSGWVYDSACSWWRQRDMDCVEKALDDFSPQHIPCRCQHPFEVADADYVSRLEAYRTPHARLKDLRTDLVNVPRPRAQRPVLNFTTLEQQLGREFDEKVARAGTFSFPVLNVPGPGYDIRVPLGRSYHKKRGGGWALCELPRCPICEGGSMATYSSAPTVAELAKRGKAKL